MAGGSTAAQQGDVPVPPPSSKARRSLPPPRVSRASFGWYPRAYRQLEPLDGNSAQTIEHEFVVQNESDGWRLDRCRTVGDSRPLPAQHSPTEPPPPARF